MSRNIRQCKKEPTTTIIKINVQKVESLELWWLVGSTDSLLLYTRKDIYFMKVRGKNDKTTNLAKRKT